MERADLFSTPLYTKDMEGAGALNQLLRADIMEWESIDPDGTPRSNRSASWHSGVNAFEREAFAPLLSAVVEAATDVFRAEGYAGASRARVVGMWANVLRRGGFNTLHDHAGCLWSGVYYVTAPDSMADLTFLDPRGSLPTLRVPHYKAAARREAQRWSSWAVSPRPGRLVLFPYWLQHYVEPNESEEPRISVSFNIEQVSPRRPAEPTGVPAYVLVPEVLSRDDITCVYSQLGDSAWRAGRVGDGRPRPEIRNNDVFWADGSLGEPWHWLYTKLARQAELVNERVYKVDISGGGQPMQFARYKPGRKYGEHADVDVDGGGPEARRTLSCVVVLRNAERGGATTFPRAGDSTPYQVAGDAIFFRADERHAALPVEAGVRDTLVVWFQRAGEG